MKLTDIIHRSSVLEPWTENSSIPWNEPGFSARMLREHLSQAHDAASRRQEKINAHVGWIHKHVLAGRPERILDLGCGPGLYTACLARLGHTCTGIDFSPASIKYAEQIREQENLSCSYQLADLRQAEYGRGFGLVMFIFGEPNVFCTKDLRLILTKAWNALEAGGILVLEPHTLSGIKENGIGKPFWYTSPAGLFSDQPHLVLEERFWNPARKTATVRYYVVDAGSSSVVQYGNSFQGYSNSEYQALLEGCGFSQVTFYPSLTGAPEVPTSNLLAITAQKK